MQGQHRGWSSAGAAQGLEWLLVQGLVLGQRAGAAQVLEWLLVQGLVLAGAGVAAGAEAGAGCWCRGWCWLGKGAEVWTGCGWVRVLMVAAGLGFGLL